MKPEKAPVVSFVIPLYNQGQFLYDAVTSAYMSYSGQCEVIIVDDASTNPKTDTYIKEIKCLYPSIKVITHNVNRGLASARNTGIRNSFGEYIQLLDTDDTLVPGKVDFQLEHLKISKNVSISITSYILSDETLSTFTLPVNKFATIDFDLKDFLFLWERGLSIPIHCALFKRETLTTNLFFEDIRAKEDWILWCQLVSKGEKISFLNTIGAVYRQHKASMTKKTKKEMGKAWLTASIEIDKSIASKEAGFWESAISWYNGYYLHHPVNNDTEHIKDEDDSASIDLAPVKYLASSLISKSVSRTDTHNYILTVLIPIYNHFEYLFDCLNSIIEQLTSKVEVLCINDNSSDKRVNQFLSELTNKSQYITIIQNAENIGISAVIGQGVQYAKGEYIAFIDCDDYLAPDAILATLDHIKKNPEIDYFFTDRIEVDEDNHFIRKALYGGYENIFPSGDINSDLMKGMIASHLKVIKKSKILEVGGCDPLLSGVQDWELALKISKSGKFQYIPRALYFHRIHSNSVTKADKAGQFRKTNIVRRRFFVDKYNHNITQDEISRIVLDYINGSIDDNKIKEIGGLVVSENEISIEVIRQYWSIYRFFIYDATDKRDIQSINFLKEYNSSFDAIICNTPEMMVSVLSYLWDPKILYYPSKFTVGRLGK